MTDNTQPEALKIAVAASAMADEGESIHLLSWHQIRNLLRAATKELRRQHARIAELEAQLESIGAGGVSGPLMGQPQAMPDLSALTERGAKAWAGVDAQGLREGRWYMVTHDGVATLCEDRRDAEEEAKAADMAWPYSGPHRAVQLVEASMAGYTAADMATAAAQGFRDGVASASVNSDGSITPGTWAQLKLMMEAGAVPLYRLLQSGVDRIEAADEFLSDDTTAWAIDPNGIFVGSIYGGHVLRPARRCIKGGQHGAE